jgi:hypothetical protein
MEDGGKKYKIILKPFNDDRIADKQQQLGYINKALLSNADSYSSDYINKLRTRLNKLQNDIEHNPKRMIEADHIALVNDGTILVGINPGLRSSSQKSIARSKHMADFYKIEHTRPGMYADDPSHTDYIVTRKFDKILSINIDNIISINGKPTAGRLDDVSGGIKKLEGHFEDE